MSKCKMHMNVGMNRTILNNLSKGRGATLKVTKQIYIPSEEYTVTLPSGEKVDINIQGRYRDVEVEFHFIRDKSKGGSGRR